MLVLTALVFAPLAFGAVYIWTFLVLQGIALGVALLWLARIWGGHKPKLLWPPLAWAVMAFVLYAIGRYFTADIEYAARQELIRVLLYAFMFLAVVCNLYNQESAELVTYTLTAVATLAASYAVYQIFHNSNQVWNLVSPYPARASGTYINPDHFAAFLELVLPLPLAFLMAARVGVITRVVLAYATLTIAAGIAVTFSRGGWVAAAVSVLALLGFLMGHRNHRLRAFLVLLVLLLAGGLFTGYCLSNTVGFMRRVIKPDEAGPKVVDASARLQMWGPALEMWRDHPWCGVGPGHFDYRFREYRPEGFQQRPEHAHNDYLELLADWGVVGSVIVVGGMVIFVIGLFKSWPHVRREETTFGTGMSSRYAFFLGAISGLLALATHSLVDFNLHIPADALAGVVVLGLVASTLRFSSKRYWWRARLPVQCIVTLVMGGLMFYLATQGWRRGGEALWTIRAEMQPNFSPEQAATLQKALAYEPNNYQTAYNIGECFRVQSMEDGSDNYAELAQKALNSYAQGIQLNPVDPYCRLRSGMCLDWLGHHEDAEKYYLAAEKFDPNGNYIVAYIGWHFVQVGDFAAARQWFVRAAKLSNNKNEMALNYIYHICEPKLIQKASGQLPMRLFYPRKEN